MAWSHDARSCTCVSQYYFPYIKGTKYGTKLQKIEKANAQKCLPLDCGRAGCFHPFWENGCFVKPRKKGKNLNTSAAGGAGALAAGVSGWPEKKNAYFSYLCIPFFSKKYWCFHMYDLWAYWSRCRFPPPECPWRYRLLLAENKYLA